LLKDKPNISLTSKINVINAVVNEAVIASQGSNLSQLDIAKVGNELRANLRLAAVGNDGKFYSVQVSPQGKLALGAETDQESYERSIDQAVQTIQNEIVEASKTNGLSPRSVSAIEQSFGSSTNAAPLTGDALDNAPPRIKELAEQARKLDPGSSLVTIGGKLAIVFSSQTQGQLFKETVDGAGSIALGYVSKSGRHATELGLGASLSADTQSGANLQGNFFVRF
jgi:hypothetical protein